VLVEAVEPVVALPVLEEQLDWEPPTLLDDVDCTPFRLPETIPSPIACPGPLTKAWTPVPVGPNPDACAPEVV